MNLNKLKTKFSPGFIQVLIRAIIVIAVLYVEKYFFPSAKILTQYNIFGRTSIIIVILAIVIFFIMERKRLLKLKKTALDKKRIFIFLSLHIVSILLFIGFKYLIIQNPGLTENYFYWLFVLRYLFPFLSVVFLGLALFDKKFIKKFYKSILISFVLSIAIFSFSQFFKKYWYSVSKQTAAALYFLLALSFDDASIVVSEAPAPLVGAGGFYGMIESPCAGIESLSLFLLLYILAIVIDKNEIKGMRAFIAGIIGLIGIFIVNIARIYIIFMIGIFYNSDLAIHYFHTNLGWILFILYFAVFWIITYGFLRENNNPENKKTNSKI